MDDNAATRFNDSLWSDLQDSEEFFDKRPLLAHYTSLEVLESILRNDEVWFSNPLFMNDHEELRWGIVNGFQWLSQDGLLAQAFGTSARHKHFVDSLASEITLFEKNHLFDTYILCFSQHEAGDDDGVLSMWRGYAADGTGAALIVDAAKFGVVPDNPLIISKVTYGKEERLAWLRWLGERIKDFLLANVVADDAIRPMASMIFERLKVAALFSKHSGFREEKEWRIVYMPDRDRREPKAFRHMFGYLNGPRGLEPKLKFKIVPLPGVLADDLSLEKLLARILIGPSRAYPLTRETIERMLDLTNKSALKSRLMVSTIPLRAR